MFFALNSGTVCCGMVPRPSLPRVTVGYFSKSYTCIRTIVRDVVVLRQSLPFYIVCIFSKSTLARAVLR